MFLHQQASAAEVDEVEEETADLAVLDVETGTEAEV
jgi:hypothetical protein